MDIKPVTREESAAIGAAVRVTSAAYAAEANALGLTAESTPAHPAFTDAERLENIMKMKNAFAYGAYGASGEMIGFLLIRALPEARLELLRLCVSPQQRGKGYGAKLHQFAQMCARALGRDTMIGNAAAEYEILNAWYQKLGYEKTGTLRIASLPYTIAFWEKHL